VSALTSMGNTAGEYVGKASTDDHEGTDSCVTRMSSTYAPSFISVPGE